MNSYRTPSSAGKVVAGLVIIAVGTIFLLRRLGYYFPHWLFSWPMILIVVGLINGAKSGFQNFAWLILTGLGTAFLLDQMYPVYQITRYTWPLLIIGAGLFMIFRRNHSWPDHPHHRQRWQDRRNNFSRRVQDQPEEIDLVNPEARAAYAPPAEPYVTAAANPDATAPTTTPESVDINAILGGVKRNIFSKNITGADITAIMGGAELNFTQADIQGRVVMDITMIMGGCKLIVPSNWEVISEITAIMGGVEDKRSLPPTLKSANPKVLVIQGVAFMGGLEIQSYI